MGKTKVMQCQEGTGKAQESKQVNIRVEFVAKELDQTPSNAPHVEHGSISDVVVLHGKLSKVREFKCKRCTNDVHVQSSGPAVISLGMDQKLECVGAFRYLGDMIGVGGGAEDASRARVRCAWAKF